MAREPSSKIKDVQKIQPVKPSASPFWVEVSGRIGLNCRTASWCPRTAWWGEKTSHVGIGCGTLGPPPGLQGRCTQCLRKPCSCVRVPTSPGAHAASLLSVGLPVSLWLRKQAELTLSFEEWSPTEPESPLCDAGVRFGVGLGSNVV